MAACVSLYSVCFSRLKTTTMRPARLECRRELRRKLVVKLDGKHFFCSSFLAAFLSAPTTKTKKRHHSPKNTLMFRHKNVLLQLNPKSGFSSLNDITSESKRQEGRPQLVPADKNRLRECEKQHNKLVFGCTTQSVGLITRLCGSHIGLSTLGCRGFSNFLT